MLQNVLIDDLRAYGYLDTLHSIHHQKTKLAIKDIPIPNYRQCRSGLQPIFRVSLDAIGVPVGTETVVVDGLQVLNQLLPVSHQTSRQKKVGLPRKCSSRFRVSHAALPKNKNPPNLSMS